MLKFETVRTLTFQFRGLAKDLEIFLALITHPLTNMLLRATSAALRAKPSHRTIQREAKRGLKVVAALYVSPVPPKRFLAGAHLPLPRA